MEQTCKTCGQTKPESEFYSASKTKCKECYKAAVKQYRIDNPELLKERDRKRNMRPDRVAAREAYAQTERGKEVGRRVKRDWAKRNPEKRAAHIILGNAVRDGKIRKPATCSRCGKGGRIHAHHHDYTLPLEVEWLCAGCHKQEHPNE